MGDIISSIKNFYDSYDEDTRLNNPSGELEFERTTRIIERYLRGKCQILDVGGGTGRYSCHFAKGGHAVHLIDAVEKHVHMARESSLNQPGNPILSCTVGDARKLAFPSGAIDIVIMAGPLYHLPDRDDRIGALTEAWRVLRPGGRVFAVAISRFASVMTGILSENLRDADFFNIVINDIETGQHRNPPGKNYFTESHFHLPNELEEEIAETGFSQEKTVAIEGPAWMAENLHNHMRDHVMKNRLHEILSRIEAERTLMTSSLHFMAIGQKPG